MFFALEDDIVDAFGQASGVDGETDASGAEQLGAVDGASVGVDDTDGIALSVAQVDVDMGLG